MKMKIPIISIIINTILTSNFMSENKNILRYLKEIDNCKEYNKTDNETCKECNTNYLLDNDAKKCIHRCNDIDYCNTCDYLNKCTECIHPYKLKDGYCILKAKTFTWVIMIYLIIIIIAAVLIFILIKPKLDEETIENKQKEVKK